MTKTLSAKDIISIIAACHDASVTSLELGNLKVKFDTKPEESEPQGLEYMPDPLVNPPPVPLEEHVRENDPLHDAIWKQTLLAEDPVAYEQMMSSSGDEDALQPNQIESDVPRE